MRFQPADDRAILIRFRPLPTVSASFTTSGSSDRFSTVHSQNEAMSAARSTESFDSNKPDSMMGIRAAAALRRLISGVDGEICWRFKCWIAFSTTGIGEFEILYPVEIR